MSLSETTKSYHDSVMSSAPQAQSSHAEGLPPMASIFHPTVRGSISQEHIHEAPHHNKVIRRQSIYPPEIKTGVRSLSFTSTQQATVAVPYGHASTTPRRSSKEATKVQWTDHPKDHGLRSSSDAKSPHGQREKLSSDIRAEASTSPTRQDSTISTISTPQIPSRPRASRPLPISDLLSNEISESPQRPPPVYSIRVRQQPAAARACGFGERDRRVIDPPPILQMDVSDPHATPEELKAFLQQPYAVVHCTLWDPVKDRDDNAMPGVTDKRQQRRLMGTLVASPFNGKDENDIDGCFFAFPDLSVRTPGRYSLRFSLVILNPSKMTTGYQAPIRSTVKSDPFQVFQAKDFSGMQASSELTKKLKFQGCQISVKKGHSKADDPHTRDENEDDFDDDDQPSSKRTKH